MNKEKNKINNVILSETKNLMRSFTFVQDDIQGGRSMVEMLGVLATAGILSVGGLAMYSSAMNKFRANELMNAISMRAMTLAAQRAQGIQTLSLAEFDDNTQRGSTIEVDSSTADAIILTLSDVPVAVCKNIYNTKGANIVEMKSGNTVLTGADGCVDGETVSVKFNNDLSETSSENNGGIPCTEGEICTNSRGFSGICDSEGKCDRTEICSQYDGYSSGECESNGCFRCDLTATTCVSEASDCEKLCDNFEFVAYNSSHGGCCHLRGNDMWGDSANEACCTLVGGILSPFAAFDDMRGCCHPDMNGWTKEHDWRVPFCTSYAVEAAKGTPGYTCQKLQEYGPAHFCAHITAESVSGYFYTFDTGMQELTYPIFCWGQGYKYNGTTCAGSISDCTAQDVSNGYCPDAQTAAVLSSL